MALLRVLADGRFHSGAELGRTWGITRSAVWKQVGKLEALGLDIHAVRGRGYRIPGGLELLDSDAIRAAIRDDCLPRLRDLQIQALIDSTNSRLMSLARGGGPSGCACLAEMQTGGRGRRGRTWFGNFGANLFLSLLWRYNSGPSALTGLSLLAGIACVRALTDHGVQGVRLKWPNDLLWDGRKLGGILVEMTGESAGPCAVVVGVGLNLRLAENAAATIDQPWTDLKTIDPALAQGRNRLAGRVLHHLLDLLPGFDARGLAPYQEEWNRHDAYADRAVVLRGAGEDVAGVARGIDPGGALLLERQGRLQAMFGGELSLRPVPDTTEL